MSRANHPHPHKVFNCKEQEPLRVPSRKWGITSALAEQKNLAFRGRRKAVNGLSRSYYNLESQKTQSNNGDACAHCVGETDGVNSEAFVFNGLSKGNEHHLVLIMLEFNVQG